MLTVDDGKKFDWENIALSDCLEGNMFDSYFTLKLYEIFEGKLEGSRKSLNDELLSPITKYFIQAEFDGVLIDEKELRRLDLSLSKHIRDVEDELYECEHITPVTNFKSNEELGDLLFFKEDTFGNVIEKENCYNLYPPKRTGTGNASVDLEALNFLKTAIDKEILRRG